MSSSPIRLLKPSSWMNLSPPPTHKCLTQFIVVNVVLPIVIYYVAAIFMADVPALALSAIPPGLESMQQLIVYRIFDPISCAQVVSILLAIFIMTLFNEPRVLLLQHSIMTVCFGIAILLSLNWEENLIWRYYREFCGTTDEKRMLLVRQWRQPNVKALTKTMCLVWGSAMLIEAIVRIGFIFVVPVNIMVILSPCIALLFTIGVLGWTSMFANENDFPSLTVDDPKSATLYQTI